METHSQGSVAEVVEEVKPYVFKRHDAEKDETGNVVKAAYFKVYKRPNPEKDSAGNPIPATELLEGFEAEEFNSPLVGHRYISGLMKAMDAKIKEKVETMTTATSTTNHHPTETAAPQPTVTQGTCFEIPLIGEEPEIHVIGGVRYFELTVHEQDGDAKRKDIYLTDGVSRDFQIMFDVPVILPSGCLNVLRESIYTQMDCVDDVQNGKVLLIEKQVPRFSIQVMREVPQVEAEEWLRGRKKVILSKV